MVQGLFFAKICEVLRKSALTLGGIIVALVVSSIFLLLPYAVSTDPSDVVYDEGSWAVLYIMFWLAVPMLVFIIGLAPKIWQKKERAAPTCGESRRSQFFFERPEDTLFAGDDVWYAWSNRGTADSGRTSVEGIEEVAFRAARLAASRQKSSAVPASLRYLGPHFPKQEHETIRLHTPVVPASYANDADGEIPDYVPEEPARAMESHAASSCDTLPEFPASTLRGMPVADCVGATAIEESETSDGAAVSALDDSRRESVDSVSGSPQANARVNRNPLRVIETEDATIEIWSEEELMETDLLEAEM